MERLINYFIPENYNLSLNINKVSRKVYGTVIITGEPKQKTVKFHAKNLNINSVKVAENAVSFKQEDDELILENLDAKKTSITIKYTFFLNTNMQGAYLSTYQYKGKEERIVSTQFESHYARECFPCIDEPEAKATFDLKIITPDTDDVVISNMPAKTERIVEYDTVSLDQDPKNGVNINTKAKKKIVEFETTPRMSTYLLAFCLGHFKKRSKKNLHGVRITSYCALNQDPETLEFANEIAADALDYYDDKFGIKYPLPKLDQVAIPDFEAGAMENWGLVTYREACMLAAPGESKATKEYIATVIAHELSHQWFGNLVTMKWWDNLWLNESFANMMEYVCVDAIRPSYHIWEYFFTGDCKVALMRDALPGVQAVQQEVNDPAEIATLFDGAIVYAKGAHLMFMLYRLMGEGNFYKGLKDYFKEHKYSNTSGDDLWKALQTYADFDVKKFMDAWITQPGYPMITDGQQQRFLLTGATDDTKWPLPEITDDMSGHYIINLSGEEFAEKMAQFGKLSEEQKIRLLLDHSLLSRTSVVSTASHLELLPHFKSEDRYAVWSSVLSLITDLKLFFTPTDPDFPKFQQYIFSLVSDNLARLGIMPQDREDDNNAKLRQIVVGLALYAEDSETTKRLANLYSDELSKINPDIRVYVMTANLRNNPAEFDKYLEKYQKEADPNLKDDLLSALTDFSGDTEKQLRLLEQHDIVRPQDHLYLFADLLRNYKTREKTIVWLYDNWDKVVEMTGEKSVEDYPRVLASSIRTVKECKAYEEFFGPLKDNPILTRVIEVAIGEINAKLRLISMDNEDVHKALRKI